MAQTNRELYEACQKHLKRLERHIEAIESTEWRYDLGRTLTDVCGHLNDFASFADAGRYRPLQLANGAQVERYEWIDPLKTPGTLPWGYVLARCETGWVTWEFSQQPDGRIECGTGHYFDQDRAQADDDYDDRVRTARRRQQAR